MTPTKNTIRHSELYVRKVYDQGVNIYYYRARYYDPEIGRFTSEASLGFAAGDVNFYAYCNNNPVNCNDPSGQVGIVGGLTGAVSGGVGGAITGFASDGNIIDAAIGFSSGFVVGGAVGFINPALSNRVGALAAGTMLGLGSNAAGQVAGNVVTDIVNNRPIQPFDNFSTSSLITSGLGAPFSATKVFNTVTTVTGSKTLGVLSAGTAEGVSSASVELLGGQVGDLFNFMIDNNLPIATPAGSLGGLLGQQLSSSLPASGGFVLYPNKPNNNALRSVYSK